MLAVLYMSTPQGHSVLFLVWKQRPHYSRLQNTPRVKTLPLSSAAAAGPRASFCWYEMA